MKFKKGDSVLIIAGKDKGKTGKIMKAMPKEFKILVEKVNLKKKHVRPRREGEKGQIVEVPAALDISNAKIICPKCGKATRVGYKISVSGEPRQGGKKNPSASLALRASKKRICKKCKQEI